MSGYILGVRPVETGYRRFEAIPHPAGIRWAKGQVPVPGGTIGFSWEFHHEGGDIYASRLVVPEGTRCKLGIPVSYCKGPFRVRVNGRVIWEGSVIPTTDFESVRMANGYLYLDDLPHGDYRMVVSQINLH